MRHLYIGMAFYLYCTYVLSFQDHEYVQGVKASGMTFVHYHMVMHTLRSYGEWLLTGQWLESKEIS